MRYFLLRASFVQHDDYSRKPFIWNVRVQEYSVKSIHPHSKHSIAAPGAVASRVRSNVMLKYVSRVISAKEERVHVQRLALVDISFGKIFVHSARGFHDGDQKVEEHTCCFLVCVLVLEPSGFLSLAVSLAAIILSIAFCKSVQAPERINCALARAFLLFMTLKSEISRRLYEFLIFFLF